MLDPHGALDLWHEVEDLLIPVECVGCDQVGVPLCPDCEAKLYTPLRRVDHEARHVAGLLPVWAGVSYSGPMRQLVVRYKNHHRRDIAPKVEAAARNAGDEWFGAVAADAQIQQHVARHLADGGALVLVPAPSGPMRRLRRRLVAAELAEAFAQGIEAAAAARLGSAPARIRTADVLRRRPECGVRGHLAGKGADARAAARRDAIRVVQNLELDSVVLLVDDVVTSGATLAASYRALKARGIRVAGALVLAQTPQ